MSEFLQLLYHRHLLLLILLKPRSHRGAIQTWLDLIISLTISVHFVQLQTGQIGTIKYLTRRAFIALQSGPRNPTRYLSN